MAILQKYFLKKDIFKEVSKIWIFCKQALFFYGKTKRKRNIGLI